MLVYGTILTWKMDRGRAGTSTSWEEHHKAIDAHGDDWARLQARYKKPMIVAGDFNQTRDGSHAYCSDRSIEMLDAQLDRNHLICVTERDFGKEGELHIDPEKVRYRHNIDHICISGSSLQAVRSGAWDHFADGHELSDHNGVFVDLASCS